VGNEHGAGQGIIAERSGNRQSSIAAGAGRTGRGAARFAWDDFFDVEHHNPHTQQAYQRAVKRFRAWVEGQGMELVGIMQGMVGQYLVGLGGSAAKRNQHLAALRGFFDRLVNRHVVILNPAASVKGVKQQVIEGKTPEITLEQARTLIQSIDTDHVMGLRDRAILATLAFTVCRASTAAGLRKVCFGQVR
jgi:site-specific recombinase XerD